MQQLRSRARLGSRADLTDPALSPAAVGLVRPPETPVHPWHPARRIRHQARDSLLVAGCSLTLSIGAAVLLWALGRWFA